MNAMLEKELNALSREEKAEVIDYLIPSVMGRDDEIPPALLTEIERRDEAYEQNPTGGMSLEEFDRKWLGRK
jgi:hypothetical protein